MVRNLIIRRKYIVVLVSKWNKVSIIKQSLNLNNNKRRKEQKIRAMNNVYSSWYTFSFIYRYTPKHRNL